MIGIKKIKNQRQKKQNSNYKKGITLIFDKNWQHVLAYADKFKSIIEPEDVETGEVLGNEDQEETYGFDWEKSHNEPLEETDEENELRPKLPVRRN